ncbi:hypothetical protein E0H75_02015 [Kribbella capetownensis]|uniref:Uncharacterized protein n=1 Tax=Kribbella capetownensis TaxID=1572659 RepID=A0A4R0JYA9_9ACTN|nr:hypothetical protein [Kribbella capetownensis]TCC52561.1 hypothetical protein E0H75_02015 [Kribbella capetownensis]
MENHTPGINRRTLLGAAGVGALGWGLSSHTTARAASADAEEWTTRAKFDALDLGFNNGNGRKDELNEDRGAVGWGEAYILQAYLLMWEAYRDPYYLDKTIDHADHMLATRDSVRGVSDWRGLSLPAWRIYWPYSAGELALADVQGRPSLRLRTAWTFAESLDVTASAGTSPGTFKITTYHRDKHVGRTYDNLTMDPGSADFAVRRINAAFDGRVDLLTAKDLRPSPDAAGDPAPLVDTMHSAYFHSSVHSGQAAYPLAWFGRIVATTPRLRSVRRYRDKAKEYLDAAEQALAVHDEEYRLSDQGGGYYIYLRDVPNNFDGVDLPHNYATSPARAYLELTHAGRHKHRRRATELVRDFVGDLTRQTDGTATWHYYRTNGWLWSGWTRADDLSDNFPAHGPARQQEDVSHAHVSITMAAAAYRARIGVTSDDMTQLCCTFSQRVLVTAADGRPTVTTNVDGSGPLSNPAYESIIPSWLGVASFGDTQALVRAAAERLAVNNPAPEVIPMFSTAYLNWAARTGARLR